MIPKIIIQTAKNKLPENIQEMFFERCPGWEYHFFLDEDILLFFQENPINEFPDIIQKFIHLEKGQFKADLFRYYFLYLKGGLYIDSDAMIYKNIHDIILDYDCVFVQSVFSDTLFNGFIATVPKNPIIYDALKHLYHLENQQIHDDYFIVCRFLMDRYKQSTNNLNIIVYKEYWNHDVLYNNYCIESKILNEKDEIIIRHFFAFRTINPY